MNRHFEVEQALRRWLQCHYGVISRARALRLGATDEIIRTRLHRGDWVQVYPGVYRDGAAPVTPLQQLRAACVASDAVASHSSAAWVWGLLPRPPRMPELTVAARTRGGRPRPGMIIHRSTDVDRSRTVTRNAIPVTDPLRTLVDLAAVAAPATLRAAVDQGLASRLVTIQGLQAEATRLARPGRRGPSTLRALLDGGEKVAVPKASVLERKTMQLITRYRLPPPAVEMHAGAVGQYRLDFAYGDIKFAFEVDGYVWHFSPEHLQRDHARRNELMRQGWVVLVYTWRDVIDSPDRVAADIAATHARLTAARRNTAS